MDQQQPVQPVQTAPLPAKQRDFTKWIVVVLLIVASIGTLLAYFLFTKTATNSSNATKQDTTRDIGPDPLQKWEKYVNTEHGYSFAYYATWFLAPKKPDNADFALQYISTTDSGMIVGKFLPANQRPKSSCDQNKENSFTCTHFPITKNREVIIDKSNYAESGKFNTIITKITDPTAGVIEITVTDPNFDTNDMLSFILSTLQFSGDERLRKLQYCPDSWSEDKKTAFIHNASFDAKDIDDRCK